MTKTLKGESRDWLSPLFCWLYAAMLLWVLGLVTLGQRAMEGYYAHGFCVENWVLLLAAAGLTGLWVWRLRVRPAKLPQSASSVRMSRARAALYLALFAVQCLMARCLWFYFAFDPSAVRQGAEALALGQPLSEEWLAYFRQCPNNAPLTVILSLVYRLGKKLGLAEPYVLEVYGAALLTNLSVATAMAVLRRLRVRPSVRWVGFGLAAVWLLFSPFIIMPYTDTYACLFPVLGLLILLTGWKAPVLLIGRGGEAKRLYPADRCLAAGYDPLPFPQEKRRPLETGFVHPCRRYRGRSARYGAGKRLRQAADGLYSPGGSAGQRPLSHDRAG